MIRRCLGCGVTTNWTHKELWDHYEQEHKSEHGNPSFKSFTNDGDWEEFAFNEMQYETGYAEGSDDGYNQGFKDAGMLIKPILQDLIDDIRGECMPQCQCDYALMVNEAERRLKELQDE